MGGMLPLIVAWILSRASEELPTGSTGTNVNDLVFCLGFRMLYQRLAQAAFRREPAFEMEPEIRANKTGLR
jgi:hypothetical protein